MRKILASSTIGLLGEQINSVLKYLDRNWIMEAQECHLWHMLMVFASVFRQILLQKSAELIHKRVEPQLYSSFWFKKVQQTLTPSKVTLRSDNSSQLAQIQSEFAKDLAGLEEVENVEAKINKRYFSCHDSEQILHYHIERKLWWSRFVWTKVRKYAVRSGSVYYFYLFIFQTYKKLFQVSGNTVDRPRYNSFRQASVG